MKTRTLLLLALACGVLIMAAGAVLLVQLNRQADVLDVTITIGGVDDADGTSGFRLIASGDAAAPEAATAAGQCAATTIQRRQCTLRFDVAAARGDSRVLVYERGDDRARWVLA
jgi:hypothetical protein